MRNAPARPGRWRVLVWSAAAAALAAPAVAMRFTDEVRWGPGDFLAAAALLAAGCAAYEFVARSAVATAYRAGAALATLAVLTLAWLELAVGLIGDGSQGRWAAAFGVLAIATAGVVVSRGRPAGLARAMHVTAVAQCVTGLAGLALGASEAMVISMGFAGLWLTAAQLFARAARTGMDLGT